ncbi:MAG TPA: hypothetical protein VGJ28_27415, partial [Micromonosporaceae bacterium]
MRGRLIVAIFLSAAWLLAGCHFTPPSTVASVADGRPGTVVVTVTGGYGRHPVSWVVADNGELLAGNGVAGAPPVAQQCGSVACYRVVPGHLAVEASADRGTTYTVAWQISGSNYRALRRAYGVAPSSTSLVVHGDVVFVANGRDGLLFRNAAGVWRRLGTPMGGEGVYWQPPHRLPTDPQPIDLTWYVIGAAQLVPLLAALLARLVRGAVRWRAVLVILGAGVGVGWLIMQIPDDFGLMLSPLVRPLSYA